jgi:hypothetical protein
VLFAAIIGLALQRFAALPNALLPALLIGFLVARIVPAGACSTPETPTPDRR